MDEALRQTQVLEALTALRLWNRDPEGAEFIEFMHGVANPWHLAITLVSIITGIGNALMAPFGGSFDDVLATLTLGTAAGVDTEATE